MSRPAKCINVDEAKGLQDNWRNTRGRDISRGRGGVDDTFDFWYSLEELQEYLDYVREKSKEQGVNKPGVRIYLGAYNGQGGKKDNSTVFLAPTMEEVSSDAIGDETQINNYRIDPYNDSAGGVPPIPY